MAAAPAGLDTAAAAGAVAAGPPGIPKFGRETGGLAEAAAPAAVPVITPYSTMPCACTEAVLKIAKANRAAEYRRMLRVIANSWKARWGTKRIIFPLTGCGNQILCYPDANRVRIPGLKMVEIILPGTLSSRKTASKIGGKKAPSKDREIPPTPLRGAGVEFISA
jgi:hypothetical protein